MLWNSYNETEYLHTSKFVLESIVNAQNTREDFYLAIYLRYISITYIVGDLMEPR